MAGDIADMMLDGTLCEGCGSYLGEGSGFPGYCSAECASNRGADRSAQDIADEAHFWRTGEFPEDRAARPPKLTRNQKRNARRKALKRAAAGAPA